MKSKQHFMKKYLSKAQEEYEIENFQKQKDTNIGYWIIKLSCIVNSTQCKTIEMQMYLIPDFRVDLSLTRWYQ